MKKVKFTTTDYNKMKRQPSAFRNDGGSPAWRKASDLCFNNKDFAVAEINSTFDAVEIEEVKRLLAV